MTPLNGSGYPEETKNKQKKEQSSGVNSNCIFCDIIKGKSEAYLVLEDDVSLAFLDQKPLFYGHCLLVPKEHYATLNDLPGRLIAPLFENAQVLAIAMEKGLGAEGSFVAINNRISQSVPHLHIHVVPRHNEDGLKGFFWPRQPYKDKTTILQLQNALKLIISQLFRSKG